MAFNPKSLANLDAGRAKGRKGVLNKTTASVKSALTEAFEQLGGVDALVRWGKSDPAAFYSIWSKMLPAEVRAEVNINDGLTAADRIEGIAALLRAVGKPVEGATDVEYQERT
ncbi:MULTISPECIES: hypothetical protein [unclassified Caballeronia]|uniref:hypothetical protein n=1 Tax=unclassified Caballeronia TaxID=2646786 RepID=UPI002028FF4D|nr:MULTISPECIES: hypothetical protein [unclassified Caballeronia]